MIERACHQTLKKLKQQYTTTPPPLKIFKTAQTLIYILYFYGVPVSSIQLSSCDSILEFNFFGVDSRHAKIFIEEETKVIFTKNSTITNTYTIHPYGDSILEVIKELKVFLD